MKRIYVAGAYSADNVLDVLRNIGRGQQMCAELFQLGYAPFCPWHDKTYVIDRPDAEFSVKQFYDFSMAWLEVSDAVLVLPGWENSSGTRNEIAATRKWSIPVYFTLDDLVREMPPK